MLLEPLPTTTATDQPEPLPDQPQPDLPDQPTPLPTDLPEQPDQPPQMDADTFFDELHAEFDNEEHVETLDQLDNPPLPPPDYPPPAHLLPSAKSTAKRPDYPPPAHLLPSAKSTAKRPLTGSSATDEMRPPLPKVHRISMYMRPLSSLMPLTCQSSSLNRFQRHVSQFQAVQQQWKSDPVLQIPNEAMPFALQARNRIDYYLSVMLHTPFCNDERFDSDW